MNDFTVDLGKIIKKASKPDFVRQAGEYVLSASKLNCPVDSGVLRNSIFLDVEENGDKIEATVYTDNQYSPYVELGTGRKGEMNHNGISPNVTPAYTLEPWWIHESQIDQGTAERYHWFYIDTEDGRFYRCDGQPAQPFLYPAIKDNESDIIKILNNGIDEILKG